MSVDAGEDEMTPEQRLAAEFEATQASIGAAPAVEEEASP